MSGASPAKAATPTSQAPTDAPEPSREAASTTIRNPLVYTAVMRRLRGEEHRYDPTFGGLYDSLHELGYNAVFVEEAVEDALFRLDAFIAVPLLNLDHDDEISVLDLNPGETDMAAVLRRFRDPHGRWNLGSDMCEWRWDLYVEGHRSDWDIDHPPYRSGIAYPERQARHPAVPAGCTIPAVGVEPHEAIQLSTRFNRGVLVYRSIAVGPRLT